ncbi:unnamed protein product [Discula destructiva]
MQRLLGIVLVTLPLALGLTPKSALETPRRSAASPNPSGEWAVFSETGLYNWETRSAQSSWKLLNLASGDISDLFDGSVNELFWIGPTPTSILYVNGTNEAIPGGVTLYIADAANAGEATLVASLPAPFQGLKARMTASGDIHFALNSKAYTNGTAYNPRLAATPASTARVYTDTFVRHWGTWLTPERTAVFTGVLSATSNDADSSYTFDGTLNNILQDYNAPVTRLECPVQPFGDQDDYDISPDGSQVAFLSKAPELPKANYTASYIFLAPFDGSAPPATINGPGQAPDLAKGASSAPRWSNDGAQIAYIQKNGVTYEADKSRLYVASVLADGASDITEIASQWDRSPTTLRWTLDGGSFLVAAADTGNDKVFVLPVNAADDYQPANITGGGKTGTVTAFNELSDGRLLVSDSSFISSLSIYAVSLADGSNKTVVFDAKLVDAQLAGLSDDDYDEFYYQGNWTQLHSWIVYPEGFDPSQKYPLAFMLHGGPQGAWKNTWSTRWNAKVWADQGYVAILPNPTASTGWGQELVDKVQNQWGGIPYDDLVRLWDIIEGGRFPFIDTDRAIEAGGSYGGFMTNWIQGHDLGRKFKALVTHDGVTSTQNLYASEELWFVQHQFNGTLWDDRENYERWDPLAHASNFATPHLVVHSSRDYRLPEAEGVMLFNVLQERGVPSRFLNFPDENHVVSRRQNSLVWHTEIFNWINAYVGLDVEQDTDTEQYVASG